MIFYADTVSLYVPFTSGVLLLVQNREIQAVHTASELGEFFGYNPEFSCLMSMVWASFYLEFDNIFYTNFSWFHFSMEILRILKTLNPNFEK